ncbi:MAG TPA: RluA family pseudouridine synthase [Candidatus Paceibacterota bacterium]|nr:RluA family pseudouridine synthase [Candidatus Paceibacterota bacterium]HRZ34197.1 RluA family pseudouridine synthase [Candidatus Paceibacterota bacterium]
MPRGTYNLTPEILKADKDFLIINKPADLVVHSDGRTKESTLCDFLLKKYPAIKGVGEPALILDQETGKKISIDRPGIVHRLDRDTSGVMIVARNQKFFEYLKKQFQDRLIEKKYHAFVYGNIKEKFLTIDEPIGRSKKNFRQWLAGLRARGEKREAVTNIEVLKRATDKSVTFIEASPKTGRTHQIRVHLKHIYHPIVCDNLYAPNRESLLGFSRMALHAKSLRFIDPKGQILSFEAPYPLDFERAISLIK